MSLELIVQHPIYKRLLKFSASTEVREKLLRLLQYFVRFLRYWKFKAVLSPELHSMLPVLQTYFNLMRKPLRVLKPLNHLNSLSTCISDELADPILRYAETLKQFGFVCFFSLDSIQLLKMIGLLGGKGVNEQLGQSKLVKNVNKYAGLMWSIALLGGLLKNLRQFQILLCRWLGENDTSIAGEKLVDEKTTPKAPILSLTNIKRDFIKNVLDFVIASNLYASWLPNDGIIGGCGVVTSAMAIGDMWRKTSV